MKLAVDFAIKKMMTKKTSAIHFSSRSNEWATPQGLFDRLNDEFKFTLDPCATVYNAKCEKFYSMAQDGLDQDWSGEIVFMNPPYGREISRWMKKAYQESIRGVTVVCLVPSRTDTRWWHNYAMPGEIRFIKGRVRFGGGKNSAPFPSAIVILKGKYRAF